MAYPEPILSSDPIYPAGWRKATLGQVTTWASGGTPSKSNPAYWGGTIPWISAKSIKSFYLVDSEDRVTDAAVANGARMASPGDILMLVRGMTLHDDVPIGVALRPMAFNQDVKRIRGANGADTRFIAYWLLAHKRVLLTAVDQASHGTGRLRTEFLRALELHLPPEPQQRAIVNVLSSLDDKIHQVRQTARTLERLARAVFRAWFMDFEPVMAKATGATSFLSMPPEVFDTLPSRFVDSEIGSVPEGWLVKPLTDAFDVNPPRLLRRGATAPYLDMKSMPTDGHAAETFTYREAGSGMRFINGDTLVARITPCLENGKTAFVDFLRDGEVGWGSTEYIVLRSKPPLPDVFGYCLARTAEFRDYAIQSMTGTSGRQRVAAAALSHFHIAIPSHETATAFGNFIRPIFSKVKEGIHESRTLTELRDLLLPKLLSGAAQPIGEPARRERET